ncbi:hypothetical protein A2U01_0094648, partial [Trifolium medium]|nr:hypothetical protein [Trifolium medium]
AAVAEDELATSILIKTSTKAPSRIKDHTLINKASSSSIKAA